MHTALKLIAAATIGAGGTYVLVDQGAVPLSAKTMVEYTDCAAKADVASPQYWTRVNACAQALATDLPYSGNGFSGWMTNNGSFSVEAKGQHDAAYLSYLVEVSVFDSAGGEVEEKRELTVLSQEPSKELSSEADTLPSDWFGLPWCTKNETEERCKDWSAIRGRGIPYKRFNAF